MNPENQNTSGIEAQLQSIAQAIIGQKTITKASGNAGTNNAVLAGAKIVIGHGYVTLSGTSGTGGTFTFPAGTFSAPPIVIANLAGVAPGSAESGGAAAETCTTFDITKNGFGAYVRNTAQAVTATFAVQYIAIGI